MVGFSAVSIDRIAVDDPALVASARNEPWYMTARDTAREAQSIATVGAWWEMTLSIAGQPYNAGSELAGLISATGELLMVGATATAECRAWSIQRLQQPAGSDDAGRALDTSREISHRATTDHALWSLIATGHHAANIALRSVLTIYDARTAILKRHRDALGQAGQQSRDHWVSLNRASVQEMRQAVDAVTDPRVHGLLDAVLKPLETLLNSTSWKDAIEARDQDWHRWRPQAAGMQGVPQQGGWVEDPATDSRSMSLGPMPYTDGDRLAEVRTITAQDLTTSLQIALQAQTTAVGALVHGLQSKP